MKHAAHVLATFYLLFGTDLVDDEFQKVFSPENVVGSKVSITLPNGHTYEASFSDLVNVKMKYFEDIEKATDGEISDRIEI